MEVIREIRKYLEYYGKGKTVGTKKQMPACWGRGEETDNKETGIPCSNGNGLKFECDSGYILYALIFYT